MTVDFAEVNTIPDIERHLHLYFFLKLIHVRQESTIHQKKSELVYLILSNALTRHLIDFD